MKRLLLNLLSLFALLLLGLLLATSWFQPPPQTRLDLFQTNLILEAGEARNLQGPETDRARQLAQVILGEEDPLKLASETYRKAADRLAKRIERSPVLPVDATDIPTVEQPAQPATNKKMQREQDALDLRTGILFAARGQLAEAQTYWREVQTPAQISTAEVLQGLWDPDIQRILPEAEPLIQDSLEGWFETTALQRLYDLQQRTEALAELGRNRDRMAIAALNRLAIVGVVPMVGLLAGLGILAVWIGSLWRNKQPAFGPAWSVPWDLETMQGVLTIWFMTFLLSGQFVPVLFAYAWHLPSLNFTNLQQAIASFFTYVVTATIGFGLLFGLTRTYEPVNTDLFQFRWQSNWPIWGVCGYLAAVPLVALTALLSQTLLPEGGGGNPILPIILDSQDWVPRLIFFVMVAVLAPLFEETLFRGFLLTSLTKTLPVWAAIAISAVLFASVHLNLADILPLTALGIVLGVIYTRSRNLLAPMLLHSCWNAGSFVALLILGGS
jgi:hypothetical protein